MRDIHLPPEGTFHNMIIVSIRTSYQGRQRVNAFSRGRFAQESATANRRLSTFGDLGMRSDRIRNWDLSLFKEFNLTERVSSQFRAEFFNALMALCPRPSQGMLITPAVVMSSKPKCANVVFDSG